MVDNTEYFRNPAKKSIKIKTKAEIGFFSASGKPEDIINIMNDFRKHQENILK